MKKFFKITGIVLALAAIGGGAFYAGHWQGKRNATIANGVQNDARKVSDVMKDEAHDAANAVKSDTQNAGNALKREEQKVKDWFHK